MSEKDVSNEQRQRLWRRAIHAFATGRIFERRARIYRRRLVVLEFLGIAVPAVVGAAVLSFGTGHPSLVYLLTGAAILGSVQLLLSVWALAARWQDRLAFSRESLAVNHRLSKSYQGLAEDPPDSAELQMRLVYLEAEYEQRSQLDQQEAVDPREVRAGHRHALHRFGRKCGTCDEAPTSLAPSDCDTCGNFPRRYLK